MSKWRKDLRQSLTAWLILVLCALPWLWYGGNCIRRQAVPAVGEAETPCVALTFDDGPRNETTTALLDGLAQRGVKVTFFVIGARIAGREEILLRMAEEGHQIGIQSQNHVVLTRLNEDGLKAEVTDLCRRLEELLGQERFVIRPPYGEVDDRLCRWLDMPVVLWSVDPMDWSDHDSARQTAAILETVEDGDIILLHDIYHASVDTALAVVDALTEQGYRFVTVDELFEIRGIEPEAGSVYRCLPPQ